MKEVVFSMSAFRNVQNNFYDLSDYGKFVYVYFRMVYKENMILFVNPKSIDSTVTGKINNLTTKHKKDIINGIHELEDKGLITIDNKSGNDYFISVEGMKIETSVEKYFTVPIEFINLVASQKSGVKLLNYYLLLLSTINIGSKVGYSSMDYLEEYCGISRQSMYKRNGKLLELGVIEIVKPKKTSDKNGNIVTTSNTYAKIGDRDKAEIKSQENLEKKLKEKNRTIKENQKEETKFEKVEYEDSGVEFPYREVDEVF